MSEENREFLSKPINLLCAAVKDQTEALKSQTDALKAAIEAASKVRWWFKAAVIIAGVALLVQIYGITFPTK